MFSIESKQHRIIVQVPTTKQFAVQMEEMATPPALNPQKGQTCWYYALNLTRLHYKHVDKLVALVTALDLEKDLQEDKEYLELINERAIEKEISAYRKFSTIQSDTIDRHITLSNKQEKNTLTESETEELKSIEFLFRSRRIALLRNLGNLNVFSKKRCEELITLCKESEDAASHNFITYIAGLAYGLKLSAWQPMYGFDALRVELKNHGALNVGGSFGSSHYKSQPIKSEEKIGNREVYFWKQGEREKQASAHAIVVMGADIIETKESKKQEVIYYIDPNFPNNVFKMSYTRFCEAIQRQATKANLSGQSRWSQHYALYAEEKLLHRHQQRFQHVLYKILAKALDVQLWHNEVSIFSSWGKDGSIVVKDASGKNVFITLPKGIRKIISEIRPYLDDEKQKGNEQKIIANIKRIANDELNSYSFFRSEKTLQFYRALNQLDVNQAQKELPSLLSLK